jgi:Dolichyl-phosphate-mannose-protein mannosyltransferase
LIQAIAEAIGVLASPIVCFLVLRLRPMAPTNLADPSMHTIYIVDPRDVFKRFSAAYATTDRLREAARVGFLVPARIDYLIFGAVKGFYVTRYALALVAVVPVYLLLRKLYGRAAGVIGILAVMSSPVVVTAWGTDYPDSAVVSYMTGALACLAMPARDVEHRLWLAAAAVLMTMAVWSHSVALPLVAATLVVWLGLRIARERSHLGSDVAVIAAVAIAVTGLLSLGSGILIGQYNYVTPTWDAYRFLSTPAQVAVWHTKGWRFVEYLPYLLVPPAVIGAWVVTFARKARTIPTAYLVVGLTCVVQTVVFAYLQFFDSVETLEEHYFSSTLWSSVCLTLGLVLCEAAKPFFERKRLWSWVAAGLVLAVPLAYEAAPREPAYLWVGTGLVLAVVLMCGGALARLASLVSGRRVALVCSALGIVIVAGCALYLSADPVLRDPYLNWVEDPAPAYSTALGSSGSELVDIYRVSAELPGFVGNATYRGEQLLMWWPTSESAWLSEPTGMYHFVFNTLPSTPPDLTPADVAMLERRKPAELLLLNSTGASPHQSLKALSGFEPRLMRSKVLHSGDFSLYVWLVNLRVFGPAS